MVPGSSSEAWWGQARSSWCPGQKEGIKTLQVTISAKRHEHRAHPVIKARFCWFPLEAF